MTHDTARIFSWASADIPDNIDWALFDVGVFESAPETTITRRPSAETVTARSYDAGILFGPMVELKWRRHRDGRLHFVVIDDRESGIWPDGKDTPLRSVEAADEGLPDRVFLWGERRKGTERAGWHESRIPKPITYPVNPGGSRMAVELRHYTLDLRVPVPVGISQQRHEIRTVVISRCRALVAAEAESEA